MTRGADVGIVGLGTMGANLARNFGRHRFKVAGYDRSFARAQALGEAHPDFDFFPAPDLATFVQALARPRRIIVLVPAGAPVDSVLASLDAILDAGDLVVDGGNSHYVDTERRLASFANKPWAFVGMGVSGGALGALEGPSMMPGGSRDSWKTLKPVLEPAAAKGSAGACVAWCGEGAAGHFVKMVHNGIEYGDMQLIAEMATLLRDGLGLAPKAVADTFERWNEGELESYLVELTAGIYRTPDPLHPDSLLLDAVLDAAGQKGTGRWTVEAAMEFGVPIPTITSAVEARGMSARYELRQDAQKIYGLARKPLSDITPPMLADALYTAKLASYAQGFALLATASGVRGWGTNLSEVARIWTAGCIIRARFLNDVRKAFEATPKPALLALARAFVPEIQRRLPALRRVATAAMAAGYAVPGLVASLAWFDTLTTARGSASLIQAQRDAFGSHGYARSDAPDTLVHSEWNVTVR